MTDQICIYFWLGVLGTGWITMMILIVIRHAKSGRKPEKRSAALSEDEWASRLHDLAKALLVTSSPDQRAAGAILLNHAHLLRPNTQHCGCPPKQIIGDPRTRTSQRTTNEPDTPHTEIR